jgi:uncharacterized protein YyaL (SSP411 family)
VSAPSPSDAPKNRLARESSPYLLLHAGNPVDWFPWGEEAIDKARREDKPLFLSVGYSTCYWCHVMERESFSDPAIARLLNEGFVCVKLDREERPDLDEIYMTATQLLTRSGGWPNSLFLTHDLKPFYAGTYFPPDDRYGRPGFPRVLAAVRDAWQSRRESVVEQADSLAEAMRDQMSRAPAQARLPGPDTPRATQAQLARRFDAEWGGFGSAPKFPSPSNLFFLLDRAAGDSAARDMLVVTLDRMARGGIHDQLAGGFHRYSTDAFWLVPHFEKMLYDNASLASLYALSAPLAPGFGFERVARATLDFVLNELTGEEGGFLSAIDAETDGHEGAYYTWTRDELEERLAPEAFELLGRVYGFAGRPNFESDRYVLHLGEPLADRAREAGMDVEELLRRLAPGRRALLDARGERARPLVDDKVLADWNGLMIGAMARGGRALGDERYLAAARRGADFVRTRLAAGGSGMLQHAYRGGVAKVPALLDDYAFLVEGLLALHRATDEGRWLAEASRVQDELDARLWDDAGGGYFTAAGDERLLFQSKPGYDGAVASGNGVAALNLLELARVTGDPSRRQRATRLLRAFGESIDQLPLAHVTLVRAAAMLGEAEGPASHPERAIDALEEEASHAVAVRGWLEGEEAGGWRPFVVEVTLRQGWHVNANPASETFLVPLVVSAASGALRRLRYPEPRKLQASFATAPILTYQDSVRVTGEIALGATAPAVGVTYQACDDTRCLPPVSVEIPLE